VIAQPEQSDLMKASVIDFMKTYSSYEEVRHGYLHFRTLRTWIEREIFFERVAAAFAGSISIVIQNLFAVGAIRVAPEAFYIAP
jgi:hypothetical protein